MLQQRRIDAKYSLSHSKQQRLLSANEECMGGPEERRPLQDDTSAQQ